jgi:hypothetical protein
VTYWNLRVLDQPDGDDGREFSLIECYYDDDGGVIGWCPHDLAGESLHDLHGQLQRLLFVVTEAITLRDGYLMRRATRGVVMVDDLPTADTPAEIAERLGDEIDDLPYPKDSDASGRSGRCGA